MRARKILLKTTIDEVDDWHIGRFSVLKAHLESLGHEVMAYDRRGSGGADQDLARLAASDVDQLWLFAVDVVDALTIADAGAVQQFRRRGGGALITRDHQDMGASLLGLKGIGEAHHFHSRNREADPDRHRVDDTVTSYISWPNYHTGANGDYQEIATPLPDHPLVQRADGTPIRYLPSHPHEGVVSVPEREQEVAVAVVMGRSVESGSEFGCAVAFDGQTDSDGCPLGRAVAQSTFHHFVDPNLDPRLPAPSFVSEAPGTGIVDNPQALSDTLRYMENIANWL